MAGPTFLPSVAVVGDASPQIYQVSALRGERHTMALADPDQLALRCFIVPPKLNEADDDSSPAPVTEHSRQQKPSSPVKLGPLLQSRFQDVSE